MGGEANTTVPVKELGVPLESPFANEPDVDTVAPEEQWKYFLPDPEKGNEGWGENFRALLGLSSIFVDGYGVNNGEARLENLQASIDWDKFNKQSFWGDINVANKYRLIRRKLMRLANVKGSLVSPKFSSAEEAESALAEVEAYGNEFKREE